MKRDVHIRKELCDVVLSSGTTMFREILERITNELTALASFTTKIKVIASIRYGLEDFFLSSLSFQQMWTSKGESTNPAPHRPQLCLHRNHKQEDSWNCCCMSTGTSTPGGCTVPCSWIRSIPYLKHGVGVHLHDLLQDLRNGHEQRQRHPPQHCAVFVCRPGTGAGPPRHRKICMAVRCLASASRAWSRSRLESCLRPRRARTGGGSGAQQSQSLPMTKP